VSIETASFPKLELIQVAEVVAREKGIERDEVIEAMEHAIQKQDAQNMGMNTIYKLPLTERRVKLNWCGELRWLRK
jgi:hypothetical protein